MVPETIFSTYVVSFTTSHNYCAVAWFFAIHNPYYRLSIELQERESSDVTQNPAYKTVGFR